MNSQLLNQTIISYDHASADLIHPVQCKVLGRLQLSLAFIMDESLDPYCLKL